MRFAFAIILFFTTAIVHAQTDSVVVKESVAKLENALIAKNFQDLQELLFDNVNFGHSTGWVQTRDEVINDCKSGKLVYQKIERENLYVAAIGKDWATVRYTGVAEGLNTGKEFKIALHVLQLWVKNKKGKWQLAARQATKLPEQPK
ncbi:MAG: nuclear transport factor 2 family protein [Chitinophagaceae bacterium]|nr:nuclear transport factor 2 family protein [Chitinophagaceae bacterium]